MTKTEMQLDAITRFLTAETEQARESALTDIRRFITKVPTPNPAPQDWEPMTRQLLLDLGVPDRLKGHPYIISAVGLLLADYDLIHAITKDLYPAIARKHDTTASRTERAIRHCVEVAWDRGDWAFLLRCFGNTVDGRKGKPTNSEFLARVTNAVRQRLQGVE